MLFLEGHCQVGYDEMLIESCFSLPKSIIVIPLGLPSSILSNGVLKKSNQLKIGEQIKLNYGNHFTIEGRLQEIKGDHIAIGLLKIQNALINLKGQATKSSILYVPIGETVVSVSGGPYHQDSFQDYDIGKASTTPVQATVITPPMQALFDQYERINQFEKSLLPGEFKRLCSFIDNIFYQYPNEWLMWLEVLQMLKTNLDKNYEMSAMMSELLQRIKDAEGHLKKNEIELLKKGLSVLIEL